MGGWRKAHVPGQGVGQGEGRIPPSSAFHAAQALVVWKGPSPLSGRAACSLSPPIPMLTSPGDTLDADVLSAHPGPSHTDTEHHRHQ